MHLRQGGQASSVPGVRRSRPGVRIKVPVAGRRAWLGAVGFPVALALGIVTPTPLALAAGALILFGVSLGAWMIRCPQCGRRLGPIIGFKYCTSCAGRIT